MIEKYIVLHWLEQPAKYDFLPPERYGYCVEGKAHATIEEATKAAEELKKMVDPCVSDGVTMQYEIKNIWFFE